MIGNHNPRIRHFYGMERIRGRTWAARLLLAALVAAATCGVLAPAARADGDPASDALLYQNLFVGWNAGVSFSAQTDLGKFVTSANRHGLAVRVAVIGAPGDLGAITQLWREPEAYATFLGVELSLVYDQRLLIVMPSGFGLNWPGHPVASAYQALAKIHVTAGGAGLVSATEAAIRALGANAGVSLTGAVPAPASRAAAPAGSARTAASTSPEVPAGLLAIVGCTVLASAAAGAFAVLARRSRRSPS